MQLKASLKGSAVTFGFMLILSLLLCTYYQFANISSQTLAYLISFVIATSFLLGSFVSGYAAGEKGLVNGILSAVFAILFISLVLLLGVDGSKDWSRFLMNLVFAVASSAIGGIIGVSKN